MCLKGRRGELTWRVGCSTFAVMLGKDHDVELGRPAIGGGALRTRRKAKSKKRTMLWFDPVMRPGIKSLHIAFYVCLLVLVGCDVHTNTQKALSALRWNDLRHLLLSMDMYRSNYGALPPDLSTLYRSDADLTNIPNVGWRYSAAGIVIADGSRWLIATPDPNNTNKLIVGRLPVEVDSR